MDINSLNKQCSPCHGTVFWMDIKKNDLLIDTYIHNVASIPYSRKYWQELNLAVGSQIAIAMILADFNLVVQYGIAICMYICE